MSVIDGNLNLKKNMNNILEPKVKSSIRDLLQDNEVFILQQIHLHVMLLLYAKKRVPNNHISQKEWHENMNRP